MYSVEDLLISHGYKLPKNAPSADKNRYANCHHEITENRSGHATVNGYETDTGAYVYSRQAPAKGYFSENECRESSQRRKAGSGNQGDTQPSGDFHTADAGFYDGSSGMYSSRQRSERDVAYWRRRGQDFSVLLNYADSGELRGNNSSKPEGVRQELFAKDPKSERESACLKEQDVVQGKRMITGNRKWQSLGTEEWKPAVGLGRQLSDGDRDKHCHRPEGGTVHPKTKGKSQSLPRVLSPESLQFVDMSAATQETCSSQRLNSKYPEGPANKEQWTENSRPGAPVSLLPKPRFSRPLKPPSYEAHQQTRGSSEMIAGVTDPKAKDGAGSYFSKSGEARAEPFSQETAGSNMEPPVYVPPPSYKTPFQQKGNQKTFHEVPNQKYRREVQQVPESRETGKWLSRKADSSWVEHQKDKSILSRKHMHPRFIDDHLGCIQYIPFDDPRLKHMPGGPCGNPLTDSDKIKNIKKEMPTDKVFEQSTQDSAFLIPPGLIYDVASKASNTEHANSNRWLSASQKGSDNLVASNQNCALYHKDQSNPYQTRMSRQYSQPDQGFAETVTQVKKFEPGAGMEKKRNSRRTLNETIFCLVSVPVHLQPNGQSSDQNNNTMTPGTVENAAGKYTGNLQNQTLRSTSSTDLELQALTGRMMNNKAGRKPQPRTDADYKEVDGLKSSQLQKHKELRYSGSWPGDQYRDQETQTSYIEPLQGTNQGAPSNQAHNQCHSDFETKELNLDTEGNRYVQHGYPMKGQMCLNPSSNSAFSRTTNFSNQVNKSTENQIQPSGNLGEKDISAMRCETKPSSASNGKAAFDKDTTNESDDDGDDNVSCNWITHKTDKTQSADLSELFEIKSAEDIPENEPLEVRAARILGIDVPVESLGIADQLLESDKPEPLTERHAFTKGVTECTNGKSGHVRGELEYSCAGDMAGSVVYVGHKEELELTKARKENNTICLQKCHVENKVKGDPENGENVSGKFLVPGAIEETMVAAAPNSDKKSRSTSRMIEALQGKLASSPSRSVLERMVRMKEVDSVSRMRRLSIKSSDSDEAEHEKTPKQLQQETFTTHRESLNNHSSQGAALTRRIITLTQRKGRLQEDEEGIYLSGRNIFGASGMLPNPSIL
ncbi:UNVERIFIED_CONTAM: hypothetical protein FKN15_006532 [Acipenser sinensis]